MARTYHSEHEHHHHHHHGGGDGLSSVSSRHHRHTSSSDYDDDDDRGHYRRRSGGSTSGRAKAASSLCLFCAMLSVVALAVGYVVASKEGNTSVPIFDFVAGALAGVGFLAGFYAEIVQLRYWNPKIKMRLMAGMPLTVLVIGVVCYNYFQRYQKGLNVGTVSSGRSEAGEVATDGSDGEGDEGVSIQLDRSPFKPGWHGDAQQGGVMAAVDSYEPNALESVLFNRRMEEPVEYACLSILNMGGETLSLTNLTPVVVMADGTETRAQDLFALLGRRKNQNADLLERLAPPVRIAPSRMAPPIPICMPENFDWRKVASVRIIAGKETLTVPGRWYTAEERKKMAEMIQTDTAKERDTSPEGTKHGRE